MLCHRLAAISVFCHIWNEDNGASSLWGKCMENACTLEAVVCDGQVLRNSRLVALVLTRWYQTTHLISWSTCAPVDAQKGLFSLSFTWQYLCFPLLTHVFFPKPTVKFLSRRTGDHRGGKTMGHPKCWCKWRILGGLSSDKDCHSKIIMIIF